ncbi:MAG: aminofutalosine synthase MqnE [Vulcanibacillus sp.]
MEVIFLFDSSLSDIREKINNDERLSFEDGIHLLKCQDLLSIGQLADIVRQKKNGDNVSFIINTHLNYTNVCYLGCKLCSFGLNENDSNAYTMSLEEIEKKVTDLSKKGFKEIHIVGGVNPKLPFEYYEEMIKVVKRLNPDIHIQGFTAVELDYIAKIAGLTIKETVIRLKNAGIGSILGGGAEIFDSEIRKIISGHKTDSDRWFEIHEITHNLGMKSNASIIYGHIEQPEHVIDHLIRLRELQDKTNGFNAFFGFAFHPDNTKLANEYNLKGETSGIYDLKMLAVARLMLDNFAHIRAFWISIGQKLAQVSLCFGVDDLDGTVMEEQIFHSAGSNSVQMIPKESFIKMIKDANRTPVERDTLYNTIKIY